MYFSNCQKVVYTEFWNFEFFWTKMQKHLNFEVRNDHTLAYCKLGGNTWYHFMRIGVLHIGDRMQHWRKIVWNSNVITPPLFSISDMTSFNFFWIVEFSFNLIKNYWKIVVLLKFEDVFPDIIAIGYLEKLFFNQLSKIFSVDGSDT
jgi:hypothetical protein